MGRSAILPPMNLEPDKASFSRNMVFQDPVRFRRNWWEGIGVGDNAVCFRRKLWRAVCDY